MTRYSSWAGPRARRSARSPSWAYTSQPACPSGSSGSVGSKARTTTTLSPARFTTSEISASKGVYPPSCSATFRPLTHTSARQSTASNRSQTRWSVGKSLGDREMPAIPADLGRPFDLVDARQLAFPGERHHDRAVVSRCPGLFPTRGNPCVLGSNRNSQRPLRLAQNGRRASGRGCSGLGMAASSASTERHVNISPIANRDYGQTDHVIGSGQSTAIGSATLTAACEPSGHHAATRLHDQESAREVSPRLRPIWSQAARLQPGDDALGCEDTREWVFRLPTAAQWELVECCHCDSANFLKFIMCFMDSFLNMPGIIIAITFMKPLKVNSI